MRESEIVEIVAARQQNLPSQRQEGVTEAAAVRTQQQLPRRLTPIPRRLTPKPMSAVLRQDTAPLLPLVYPPNNYKTIEQLILRGKHQERHRLAFATPPPRWAAAKDANNWSSLKKIYKRVDTKRQEMNPHDNFENRVSAAKWLDTNERAEMTMSTYVKHLRDKYYCKRK